ncbi:hypothetical protein SASPL_147833 [Salvia splendens]|uniref:Uncharacterized protein n=1 Tax=Salvia splendens TaxID=180675 RepID=A0A8X8WFU7_SALSN|nr:hypothetical protein SASPL_147833 [Salvia splendens]
MEGMSSAAIEVLVQNLLNLFKDEYSLLRGLDEDAQQLQRTLGIYIYLEGSCYKLKRLPSVDALNQLTKLEELHIKDFPELSIDSEWCNLLPGVDIRVDGKPV